MNFREKVTFLQNSLHLSDGAFCTRYKIKLGLLKKLKAGQIEPTSKDVKTICKEFNLDVTDFLNDASTLSKVVKPGEHPCAVKPIAEKPNTIYEDYVREDNSRYEEKD
jgi:hypothetical protein